MSSAVDFLHILGKLNNPDAEHTENSDFSIFDCPICLDILCEPVTLQCGHSFCDWCIYRWITSEMIKIKSPSADGPQAKFKCPKCQSLNPVTFDSNDYPSNLCKSYKLRDIILFQQSTKYMERLNDTSDDRLKYYLALKQIGSQIKEEQRRLNRCCGIERVFDNWFGAIHDPERWVQIFFCTELIAVIGGCLIGLILTVWNNGGSGEVLFVAVSEVFYWMQWIGGWFGWITEWIGWIMNIGIASTVTDVTAELMGDNSFYDTVNTTSNTAAMSNYNASILIAVDSTSTAVSTPLPNYDSVYSPGNYLSRNELGAMYNEMGWVLSKCDPIPLWPEFGDDIFWKWNTTELKYFVNEYEIDVDPLCDHVERERTPIINGDGYSLEYWDNSLPKCHTKALKDYLKQKEMEELQRDNVHAMGLMQYLNHYGVDYTECMEDAFWEMEFGETYECLADHAATVQMSIDVYWGKEWLLEKKERPKTKRKKGLKLNDWMPIFRTLPIILVNLFDLILFTFFG